MKIGEIKKQSLLLIFPEIEARFDPEDDESVNEGIAQLKCDPSIRSYLEGSVSAINRALCEIENAGATRTKCVSAELNGETGAVDLTKAAPEAHTVLGVYQNGKSLRYTEQGSTVFVHGANGKEVELSYKSTVQKVRYATEDSSEIDLDYGVCALIPYFVASELCCAESDERARVLRAKFFEGLASYSKKSVTQGEVEAVYSW